MTSFTITTSALSIDGNREILSFRCPSDGGYVRFDGGAWDGSQVCERLATRGNTLMADARTLPSLIRGELARRRRWNARWAA